jgi:glutaredoxin
VKASRSELLGLIALVLAVSTASSWWVRRSQGELGAQVAGLAKPGDIQMLSSVTCGVCTQARQWFVQHQIPFKECLIEKDAACRATFEQSRSPGTPLIVVRGRQQVGFNATRVLDGLKPTL